MDASTTYRNSRTSTRRKRRNKDYHRPERDWRGARSAPESVRRHAQNERRQELPQIGGLLLQGQGQGSDESTSGAPQHHRQDWQVKQGHGARGPLATMERPHAQRRVQHRQTADWHGSGRGHQAGDGSGSFHRGRPGHRHHHLQVPHQRERPCFSTRVCEQGHQAHDEDGTSTRTRREMDQDDLDGQRAARRRREFRQARGHQARVRGLLQATRNTKGDHRAPKARREQQDAQGTGDGARREGLQCRSRRLLEASQRRHARSARRRDGGALDEDRDERRIPVRGLAPGQGALNRGAHQVLSTEARHRHQHAAAGRARQKGREPDGFGRQVPRTASQQIRGQAGSAPRPPWPVAAPC